MSHLRNATAHLLTRLRQLDLPEPEPEWRFHGSRRWRLDLAWPAQMVAVEIHGGLYVQGRHNRAKGFELDRAKMNAAALAGWLVLEYSTGQILRDEWVEDLRAALRPTDRR